MNESRPVTMRQIADRIGVSRATVSNALRGTGRLSDELAERVRRLADEAGYVPSHAGRSLRTGKSTNVGLVVPNFNQPLFPLFVHAVERAAKRRGFAVLVGDSMGGADTQRSEILNLVARGVDALVVIPVRGSAIDASVVPVPMAVMDSVENPLNTASSDHRDGGRLIARHLAALGHRRVLVLAGSADSAVGRERVAGMTEVFGAEGIAWRLRYSEPDFETGRAIGEAFRPGGETACAAAYDALAVGFITALVERGIGVPEDVSVTGYDDLIWGRIVSPQLTTIRQDLLGIAEHALAVVTGEAGASRLFPVTLVERSSTARPGPSPTLHKGQSQ